MTPMAAEARTALLERRAALEKLARELAQDAQELRETPEIEAALARIEAGVYGQCESCGGAIGRQRLRAIPEARFCLACAARASRAA